jgi:hypothetical protein
MKYWWIIANDEKWDWVKDHKVGTNEEWDALTDKNRIKKYFKEIEKDDKVIGYSAGNSNAIVSLGIIEKPLYEKNGKKIIEIRKIRDLEKSIPIEQIRTIPLFDKKFDNIKLRTTIIKLDENDYNIILGLEQTINGKENEEDETEGNKKNTNKRKKILNCECEYDPYHDQMQNAIFELLKTSKRYDYKKVIIEKGGVDIKAKTQQDTWHYFELKTDNPKQSIRTALGQILEYSYYPDTNKAEKLIIVADEKPNVDEKKYLDHIRNKFNIPITYRYFNLDNKELSDDY